MTYLHMHMKIYKFRTRFETYKNLKLKFAQNVIEMFLLYFQKQKWILTVLIKQFVVTNCSKERPGSIVTETLKNGILIPIVPSKEWYFNADFKYISFIKISFTNQKLRACENLPHFRKF